MTDADVYDHGFTSAILRRDFEEVAGWYALGCICSDSYLRTYDHLERGYAEGMKVRAAVTNLSLFSLPLSTALLSTHPNSLSKRVETSQGRAGREAS